MGKTTKASLELGARHAEVVQSAIRHWVESSTISQSQASLLADTIVVQTFDWEKFAKYTLRLAVLFFVVAVTSVVFEKRFVRIFRRLVELPPWLRGAATGAIAVGIHLVAHQRSQRLPEQKYANEAIHGVGALFFALAAYQLLEQLNEWFTPSMKSDIGDASQSKEEEKDDEKAREKREREVRDRKRLQSNSIQCVILGLATVYGAVGILSRSNFIWSCCMLVLGNFCGGMGGYQSGTYWIDMELPLLFTGFGSSLIGAAPLMRSYAITAPLWSTTQIWGLLYFFVSLWIMSIWGYDGYIDESPRSRSLSRRTRMFLWSLVFFVAAGGSTWHGLRYDDSTTKGFGLTFLGINLYTKYFEWGWGLSKPLFFAVLAGTFAVVGRYAEDVWNMRVGTVR